MTYRFRQLATLYCCVGVYAALAFVVLALGMHEQLAAGGRVPSQLDSMPSWLIGLANAGIIILLYGALGTVGFALARKLDWPGVYREHAGWRAWVFVPAAIGAAAGLAIGILDTMAVAFSLWRGFDHPPFPLSIIASATAGIGEEILFRGFFMVLWALALHAVLKRWRAQAAAFWIANIIAALAFGAAHLPSVMMLLDVSTVARIPGPALAELFAINALVGIAAGERYMRDGLVAAIGVHFWADIVWHVIWPMIV